ncbi:olfactory receptor 6N1-like [Spea bombifrons]|uniref:olfactory receptor 6N1-like n=1 Tax=Spea bombifrons TaxID=233779 RepID=UPI00234B0520|nr:olfactory receptor 6N1-like [Spea bombifrons]
MDVNLTHNSDFRLRGFDHLLDYRICLFVFFLFTYVLTLSGNMVIVLVVRCHVHLHTPMYFFIINLSILEMWYISTTVPKLLELLVTNNNLISFHWCFAQLYMFHGLGMTECALLAIMAFDRRVAICNPLRYTTLMNETTCKQLASLCWAYGFLAAIVPMMTTLKLPLCGPRDINHYFCDLAPLASLSCVDTSFNDIINSCVIGFATMFNLAFILVMYLNIIFSVVRLRSNMGRKKAFSTCSSHITVVALFYSTAFTIYGIPKHAHAADYQKIVALVYAMFTPLLNPVIYSLRNKEVKEALGRSIKRVMGKIGNGKLL